MVNRLEPLNLMDFTGGLNLRTNQFQLADNESPDLLNVDIDPRGGFYTRRGWRRWNTTNVADPLVTPWKPRNAFIHTHANGTQYVNVVNDNKIYWAGTDGVFAQLPGITADAVPHCADFAAWGDVVYVATGMFNSAIRVSGEGVVASMLDDTWSEVESPTSNTMPQAEFVAGHAGYLFVACTSEADGSHNARVRWSHPNKPDSWRADDFLDIDSGGGRITGLMPFRDHLIIFKTNSMWALYGYDEDSWQLIKVSISVGCPAITAATRSETSVFFFSASDKGGIYGYQGQTPTYLSENLRPAFEDILSYTNVFVSWAGRRLWVGVPWVRDIGSTASVTSLFVFDPDIGEGGAWTMYRSNYGAVGPVLDGSDVNAKYPLAAFWSDQTACMVTLDQTEDAHDLLLPDYIPGYLTPSVGTVTTPNPGPLPAEFTITVRLLGPTTGDPADPKCFVNQFPSSWGLSRRQSDGFWFFNPAGSYARSVAGAVPTGGDEMWAVSVLQATGSFTSRRSVDDGATWQQVATATEPVFGTLPTPTEPVRIGSTYLTNWTGRIYSVELRTGLDPAAGTVVWRFDANDYPGTGTSYVDPRGRTWTLTTAAAITPKEAIAPTTGQPFDSYYRTRWLHAGWPDRKKSWRRPTFVCRQVPQSLDLIVETFRDYNETTVHRTRTLRVRAEGDSFWTETGFAEADIGGFDWTEGGKNDPTGTGSDWGLERRGSNLVRSGSMGLARSVQMRVRASPSSSMKKWGVDGIVAKFVQRRFR